MSDSTESSRPEFSHMVDRRSITEKPVVLAADATERAALAKRFDVVSVDSLKATVSLEVDGEDVRAAGQLEAQIVQSCAVSGEDLPVAIAEPLDLLFVPEADIAPADPEEEIELTEEELDEIPYTGTAFDLGEAVAQSLALAIDPFATGPGADEARRRHGLIEEDKTGPLADALRGLQPD